MEGAKILIIEDDIPLMNTISNLLLLESFDVYSAANGEVGVELAIQILPDLIVSDVMMPKLNGLEVLNQLRNKPDTSLIPFIFLTAKAELKDIRKAMLSGADDYITKPFDNEDLIQSIKLRLEKQRAIIEHGNKLRNQRNIDPEILEGIKKITAREKEVIELLCSGMSINEIAEHLKISFHTVDSHRKNIKRKLKAKTIADIVRITLENRFV